PPASPEDPGRVFTSRGEGMAVFPPTFSPFVAVPDAGPPAVWRLIDLRSMKSVAELNAPLDRTGLALSADGKYLGSHHIDGKNVRFDIWSFPEGKLVRQLN